MLKSMSSIPGQTRIRCINDVRSPEAAVADWIVNTDMPPCLYYVSQSHSTELDLRTYGIFHAPPPSSPRRPCWYSKYQRTHTNACIHDDTHSHHWHLCMSGRVKHYPCDEAAIVPPYPCPQRPLAALHYRIICLQFYSRVGTWDWRCIHTVRFSSFPFVHWKRRVGIRFFNLHSVLALIRSLEMLWWK